MLLCSLQPGQHQEQRGREGRSVLQIQILHLNANELRLVPAGAAPAGPRRLAAASARTPRPRARSAAPAEEITPFSTETGFF